MSLMSPSPRSRARALLLSTTLLAGCATSSAVRPDLTPPPTGATAAAPQAPPAPPIHFVNAGDIEGFGGIYAYYVIDVRTQTCWFLMHPGYSPGPLSCCAARRVPEVRRLVTWESDASCAQAAPPAPAAAPPAPASPGAAHP